MTLFLSVLFLLVIGIAASIARLLPASLDLTSAGFSFNTVPTENIDIELATILDGGQADIKSQDITLFVDTTLATDKIDLDDLLDPIANKVSKGCTLTVVKANPGGAHIEYQCPITNYTYSYVDRQGESITLEADTVEDQWVVRG